MFWQQITKLLESKDCVIIPGFGAFVANYQGSSYNPVSGIALPPRREFIFNQHIQSNDGLLQVALANHLGTTYENAGETLTEVVLKLNKELKTERRINISDFGFLYMNAEGNVVFENDSSVFIGFVSKGYYPVRVPLLAAKERFELQADAEEKAKQVRLNSLRPEKVVPEISIPKEEVQAPKPVVQKVTTPKKEKEERKKEAPKPKLDLVKTVRKSKLAEQGEQEDVFIEKKRFPSTRTILKYAAIFLPTALYSIFLSYKGVFDQEVIQTADLVPFGKKEVVYFPGEQLLDAQYYAVEDVFAVSNSGVEKELTFYPSKANRSVATSPSSKQRYHIIIGCFSEKENAQELASQVRGASILDKRGRLYRVTAGGFASRSDAETARRRLKQSGQDSWVLDRK